MRRDPKQGKPLAESLCRHLVQTLQGLGKEIADDGAAGDLARGKVFQLAGYHEDAIESYESALCKDSTLDEAAARLVRVRLMARQHKAALASAVELVKRNKGYELKEMTSDQVANSMTLLGDALAVDGRLGDSIEAYKLAATASKNDSFAGGRLAQAYLAAGEPQNAVAQAAKVGNNPRFHSVTALLDLGRQNTALLPRFTPGAIEDFIAVSDHGRPLFVEGASRVAPVVSAESAWCKPAE